MIKKIVGIILLTTPIWLWVITQTIENVDKFGILGAILYWILFLSIFVGLHCLGFHLIAKEQQKKKKKEVFVVTADTYNEECGAYIELFGVYSNFNVADKASSFLTEKGYLAQVNKVEMNKATYISLGGYIE